MTELIYFLAGAGIVYILISIRHVLERIDRTLAEQNVILSDEEHTIESQCTDNGGPTSTLKAGGTD